MSDSNSMKPPSTTLESLPVDVILCVLDFLPMLDYYNLKLAGARYITDVIREATSRIPRGKYLQAIQKEDTSRRKTQPNFRRPALEIMIERGQSALVLYYKRKYQKLSSLDISSGTKESYAFIPALHWAAYYGSIKILGMLLDRVNIRSSRGWTALHFAAMSGQVEAARILLEHGAEVNAMDQQGKTPLDFAVECKQNLMAGFLKGKGATQDINALFQNIENNWSRVLPLRNQCTGFKRKYHRPFQYEAGTPNLKMLVEYFGIRDIISEQRRTYLQERIAVGATLNDQYHLLLLILNDGFEVNKQVNTHGFTLLHISMRKSSIEIIRLLMDRGADITAVNRPKRTAFAHALIYGREDVVQFLLDNGLSTDIIADEGLTGLHDAVTRGSSSMIRYFIQKGADIEKRAPATPLELAVLENKIGCVIALLDAGADIEARDHDGNTPLLAACKVAYGREDIIRILLEYGANVNVQNSWKTPLHYYPSQLLMEHGADINLQIDNNDSPFHIALKRGETAASIATDPRGDVHSMDKEGRSPLHLAVQYRSFSTVSSIISRGAIVTAQDWEKNTPLHYAFRNFPSPANNDQKLELLLSRKADINARNNTGLTPLLFVTKSQGAFRMVRLLKYNPDVHVADNQGRTALHFASMYRYFYFREDFEALLKAGADVNKEDDYGLQPLFYAIPITVDDIELRDLRNSTTELLLKYGADPKGCDRKKRTPLHYAALYRSSTGWADLMEILVDHGADPNMRDENGYTAAEFFNKITQEERSAITKEISDTYI